MKYTAEYVKDFGLWLGNNLKENKGKTIDELFDTFAEAYQNERQHNLDYIHKVIKEHGAVSCFELEDEASPMITSIGDTMVMVEGYGEFGVDTATYVNDIETNSDYLRYVDLEDDVLEEIASVMENYEADCIQTAKRIED